MCRSVAIIGPVISVSSLRYIKSTAAQKKAHRQMEVFFVNTRGLSADTPFGGYRVGRFALEAPVAGPMREIADVTSTDETQRRFCLAPYLCLLCSSIAVRNLGVWFFSSVWKPGSNSCKTFIPTSLPIVEPKSLNGSGKCRLQYGVEAVSLATEVSVRSRYEVFSLAFPESSRVIRVREAA